MQSENRKDRTKGMIRGFAEEMINLTGGTVHIAIEIVIMKGTAEEGQGAGVGAATGLGINIAIHINTDTNIGAGVEAEAEAGEEVVGDDTADIAHQRCRANYNWTCR